MASLIVKQSTGNRFQVGFSVSDSILDIKERIHCQRGIPVANQVLWYDGGCVMDDNVNIFTACHSFGIHINLAVNIQLTVHISDTGNRFLLQYEMATPLGPLKQIIGSTLGLPADKLRLFIGNLNLRDDNGTLAGYGVNVFSVALDVLVEDELTIRNRRHHTQFKMHQIVTEPVLILKKRIETISGTAVERLLLYSGDQELHDGMTLASYGVADGSVIEMRIKIQLKIDLPLDVVNSLDESILFLLQDDTEPVRRLKERIGEHVGVSTDNLVLFMDMHEIEDDRALSYYKARDGSEVFVMIHDGPGHQIELTVRIVDGGRQYSMVQDKTLPISRLRMRIRDVVRVPMDRITLSLSNGTKLEDFRTLADYGLADYGSVVDVDTDPVIEVRVKSMCGKKTITVNVRASDRISELRRELSTAKEQQGFPLPKEYFFILGGNVLYDENMTFLQEGIKHRDIVEVFRGFIAVRD